MPTTLDINPQFQNALNLLENTGKHLFVTGKAGTGKSTLLHHFKNTTKKNVVVLAPTGVAAINIGGQTIHSFFGFKADVTKDSIRKLSDKDKNLKLYKQLDMIIIDEISMVRSDLLDHIDRFLGLNGPTPGSPFGGVQMVFIGDLYQLPPVITQNDKVIFQDQYQSEYFFDAAALKDLSLTFVELEKIYRQSDQDFINLLNSVRNNSITPDQIEQLNQRFDPNFQPDPQKMFIYLTSTNSLADEINQSRLSATPGKTYRFQGEIYGQFEQKSLPTEVELSLKVGSQIMMLNNDTQSRWVNGTVGTITDIKFDPDLETDQIQVQVESGQKYWVEPHTWEIFRFIIDPESHSIKSEVVATFSQFPMKLAWAVTIHKSQGKTFDHVIIDVGRGTFAHGQMYVALSRCRTFEGMILKQPIKKSHIMMDYRVRNFLTRFQYQQADELLSHDQKLSLLTRAILKRQNLTIVYLKANDEKSTRTIEPKFIGNLVYKDKTYHGITAFDHKWGEERNFRLDRILEISTNE